MALEAEQIVRIASEAKRRGKSTSGFASELLEKALGLLGETSPTEEDKRAAVVEELLRIGTVLRSIDKSRPVSGNEGIGLPRPISKE